MKPWVCFGVLSLAVTGALDCNVVDRSVGGADRERRDEDVSEASANGPAQEELHSWGHLVCASESYTRFNWHYVSLR